MITRGKAALVNMPALGGLLGDPRDKQPERECILHNSLTGKEYSKRKSRSKIARASRKRNRK